MRVEVRDRALDRVRATLRAAGLREVGTDATATTAEHPLQQLVRLGSGPVFNVGARLEWCRPDDAADRTLADLEAVVAAIFAAADRPAPTCRHRLGAGLEILVDDTVCATLRRDTGRPALASLDLGRVLALACDLELPAPPRARSLDRIDQLGDRGWVDRTALPILGAVESRLAVGVSPAMAARIERPDDAIGLQFIPDVRELQIAPEELPDPIGDHAHTAAPGLVHRYRDRALLKPTHLCAVYCRFCFRRDVVGDPSAATIAPDALAAALAEIRARPEIWEVILTGGDPLVLAPSRLAAILTALRAIPHVRVLRIHSRVPLVAPERVTPALVRVLRDARAWLVLHANHAREFTPAGAAACAALIDAGVPMLSQSVLLKGVNDDIDALEHLLRTLVEHRIKPYYLHHADLVEGTSHLRVALAEGRRLVRELRGRVSGLCQPLYVLDIPGGHGKVPAAEAWIAGPDPDGAWQVTDARGAVHRYREP